MPMFCTLCIGCVLNKSIQSQTHVAYALTLAITTNQEFSTYSRFIHSCDKSTKIQLGVGLFENGLDNITGPSNKSSKSTLELIKQAT